MRDEAIPGVERVEAPHDPVPHHLGHNRGSRNRGAARVSVDDGPVRRGRGTEPKAVDETRVGRWMEISEDRAQPSEIRAVQPRSVDLARRHDSHADRRGACYDGREELLALVRRHLLRVVQHRERSNARPTEKLVIEQHPGDDERPCERSATGFVGTGHEAHAETSIEPEETLADGSSHAAESTGSSGR
jgi:hypothetical protein